MGYLAARLGKEQPSGEERARLIEALKQAILLRCAVRSILVFGSALTSDFTHASDIDVAVTFDDDDALRVGRRQLFRSPPLISSPYDLLLFTQREFDRRADQGGICQVIRDSGQKIHG